MRLKVRLASPRWRSKRVLKEEKKFTFPLHTGVKSRLQFGSLSARELTPIGSDEAAPILEKCFVTSWKGEEETDEFFLSYEKLFLDTLEPKKAENNIGPGSYDIIQWPENIVNKTRINVKRNLGFGLTPRFLNPVKFSTPGPGYVGKNHNPYYYIENKRKRGFSSLPTFERDGLAPRNKIEKSISLAPNRYKYQHPDCLDNFLKKKIGKRGPYDLFTGPRDNSTVKGYFSSPIIFHHSDWPKRFPGDIEKLLHKSNHFKGVFAKSARFPKKPSTRIMHNDLNLCFREPSHPGPGHYDPQVFKETKNLKKYPFGKSLERGKKLGNLEIHPCPGQYDSKIKSKIKGSGWTWVFKSKLPRIKSLVKEPYNDF